MQRIPAWPTGIASHIVPSSCGTLDRQRVANEARALEDGAGQRASVVSPRARIARHKWGGGSWWRVVGRHRPARFARVLARRRDALDHAARFTDLVNQKSHQHDRRWASPLHCLRQTAKR
jgi:hypothetical protein